MILIFLFAEIISYKSIFDPILFDNNPSVSGHNKFLNIIEHEVSLHNLPINAGELVVVDIPTDDLS